MTAVAADARRRPLCTVDIEGVEVRYWHPLKAVVPGRWGRRVPLRRRVSNFGDHLGPLIVRELVRRRGLRGGSGGLLSIGSVLHLVEPHDAVWGSGVNGKQFDLTARQPLDSLSFCAVRGPSTARFVEEHTGRAVTTFGDPALLLADLFPALVERSRTKSRRLTVVPNLNDLPAFHGHPDLLDPRGDVEECLRVIASSELVVASSLHGLVVADALGIPNVLLQPRNENLFKYHDYYGGRGDADPVVATDLEQAVAAVTARRHPVPSTFDTTALSQAFPAWLWVAS